MTNFPLNLAALLESLNAKRKVFVSYHHDQDQAFYNTFVGKYANVYDCIHDNSLERVFDSDDCDYVMQRIREKHITGSSATVVLCGGETPWRKYVDWEIKATLDKQHGLIGVMVPSCPRAANGNYIVPDRLHANIQSGYATMVAWDQLSGPQHLKSLIEASIAAPKLLIRNSLAMRARNG